MNKTTNILVLLIPIPEKHVIYYINIYLIKHRNTTNALPQNIAKASRNISSLVENGSLSILFINCNTKILARHANLYTKVPNL